MPLPRLSKKSFAPQRTSNKVSPLVAKPIKTRDMCVGFAHRPLSKSRRLAATKRALTNRRLCAPLWARTDVGILDRKRGVDRRLFEKRSFSTASGRMRARPGTHIRPETYKEMSL